MFTVPMFVFCRLTIAASAIVSSQSSTNTYENAIKFLTERAGSIATCRSKVIAYHMEDGRPAPEGFEFVDDWSRKVVEEGRACIHTMTYRKGLLAGLLEDDRVPERRRLRCYYYDGKRTLMIRRERGDVVLYRSFWGPGIDWFASECFGILDQKPMAGLLERCKQEGTLRVVQVASGFEFRFPDEDESIVVSLTIDAAGDGQIQSVTRYRGEERIYFAEYLGFHEVKPRMSLPAQVRYRYRLERDEKRLPRVLVTLCDLEWDMERGYDGQAVAKLALQSPVLTNNEHTIASAEGCDSILYKEAGKVRINMAMWKSGTTSTKNAFSELARLSDSRPAGATLAEIKAAIVPLAQASWPKLESLQPEGSLYNIVDLGKGFCAQASLSILSYLSGKAVSFADIFAKNAGSHISLKEVEELIEKFALGLHVRRVCIEDLANARDPFLINLQGTNHMSVGVPLTDYGIENKTFVWEGPNQKSSLLHKSMAGFQDAYCFLTQADIERIEVLGKSRTWTRLLIAAGALLVLGGASLIYWKVRVR